MFANVKVTKYLPNLSLDVASMINLLLIRNVIEQFQNYIDSNEPFAEEICFGQNIIEKFQTNDSSLEQ